MFTYKPVGTCSKLIEIDATDGVIHAVRFTAGCDGNLAGMSRLLEGMPIDRAIEALEGIQCQNGTSCPDQLSKALRAMQQAQG